MVNEWVKENVLIPMFIMILMVTVGYVGGCFTSYGFLAFIIMVGGGAVPRMFNIRLDVIMLSLISLCLGWMLGVIGNDVLVVERTHVFLLGLSSFTVALIMTIIMIKKRNKLPVQATVK